MPDPSNSAILGNMQPLGARAASILSDLLPPGWRATWQTKAWRGRLGDGEMEIQTPRQGHVRFNARAVGNLEPRDVSSIATTLRRAVPTRQGLLVSPFVSDRSRELLTMENISFIDLTGNIRLFSERPEIFIDRRGSGKNPKPTLRSRTSFRGPITGRIVRFLCETPPPLAVRKIADVTKVNPGNVSRILELAAAENLIDRGVTGNVTGINWEALLRRWSADLKSDREEETFLDPRGFEHTLQLLASEAIPYAITGQYAAWNLVRVAPPVAVDIYVTTIQDAKERLRLRNSQHVGNVRLIDAYDDVVFDNMHENNGLHFANASQVAADILTLPHRSSEEYDELISWMRNHGDAWQRR